MNDKGLEDPILSGPDIAVVETDSGKVQGYRRKGVYTYLGVPYAQAERFMPPQKVDPWEGVRVCMSYGNTSLQFPPPPGASAQLNAYLMYGLERYWVQSDHCQNLNIWTNGINDGKKRPVIVWIHGGGFILGSSFSIDSYNGENLARKGDVVFVSVNHRLGVVGHLDLSAYGEEYKTSGNNGMLDLVAALEWVRNNIAHFGGDPDNVTIVGQSGGGGKVLSLLSMPAAKGLFHKAIAMSVPRISPVLFETPESQRVAELTLEECGLSADQVDALKTMPYSQLMIAGEKALDKTSQEPEHFDACMKMSLVNGKKPGFFVKLVQWAPVRDGVCIPYHPMDGGFSPVSPEVPLIVGTTLNETSTSGLDVNTFLTDNKNFWNEDEVTARLTQQYGERADAIAEAFLKAYPDKKRADALYVERDFRLRQEELVSSRADLNGGAVYSYIFSWETPALGGFPMAYHVADIPFMFDNIDRAELATGGGEQAHTLAHKMSNMLLCFARTGDPNSADEAGLPYWPAYTRENGATMIFDNTCTVAYHHDKELLSLL